MSYVEENENSARTTYSDVNSDSSGMEEKAIDNSSGREENDGDDEDGIFRKSGSAYPLIDDVACLPHHPLC